MWKRTVGRKTTGGFSVEVIESGVRSSMDQRGVESVLRVGKGWKAEEAFEGQPRLGRTRGKSAYGCVCRRGSQQLIDGLSRGKERCRRVVDGTARNERTMDRVSLSPLPLPRC